MVFLSYVSIFATSWAGGDWRGQDDALMNWKPCERALDEWGFHNFCISDRGTSPPLGTRRVEVYVSVRQRVWETKASVQTACVSHNQLVKGIGGSWGSHFWLSLVTGAMSCTHWPALQSMCTRGRPCTKGRGGEFLNVLWGVGVQHRSSVSDIQIYVWSFKDNGNL